MFNLNSLDLATAVACDVKASKLILMMDPPGFVDRRGAVIRELTVRDAREFLSLDQNADRFMECAIRACQFGVGRVHIVDRAADGVLIEELFTRDGGGTLVSNEPFDQLRLAKIEDVGGILGLIEPLEEEGFLVKRSREKLEIEIDHFSVIVRESVVVACGALYPIADEMAEIACIAVHRDYRRDGFGNVILGALEKRAKDAGLRRVFVLTTQATHWFQENGYTRVEISDLPNERQTLYNLQRNSIILSKRISRVGS